MSFLFIESISNRIAGQVLELRGNSRDELWEELTVASDRSLAKRVAVVEDDVASIQKLSFQPVPGVAFELRVGYRHATRVCFHDEAVAPVVGDDAVVDRREPIWINDNPGN